MNQRVFHYVVSFGILVIAACEILQTRAVMTVQTEAVELNNRLEKCSSEFNRTQREVVARFGEPFSSRHIRAIFPPA